MEHFPIGQSARLVLCRELVFTRDDVDRRRVFAIIVDLQVLGERIDFFGCSDQPEQPERLIGADLHDPQVVTHLRHHLCRGVGTHDRHQVTSAAIRAENTVVAGALLPHVIDHAHSHAGRDIQNHRAIAGVAKPQK
jgi:hypothetical protein